MGGIPSKPDPSRTIEVVGCGYARTGTMSLQLALEKLLDGPVQHGGTHFIQRTDDWSKDCAEVFKATRLGDHETIKKLLKKMLAGYAGLTDHPYDTCLADVHELWPDAKFILVRRDPEQWWPSHAKLLAYADDPILPLLTWPSPGIRYFTRVGQEWRKLVEKQMGDLGLPLGPDILRVHEQWVLDNIPKEQLLVIRTNELAWEPLCKFLGKPIPDEPFPRVNEAKAIDRLAAYVMGKCLLRWIGLLSTAVGVPYLAFKFYIQ